MGRPPRDERFFRPVLENLRRVNAARRASPFQFGLGAILIAMTVLACFLALARLLSS